MTALTNNVPTVTEDYHFILDITFECQHPEVNAMVKSKLNVKDRYHVKTFHPLRWNYKHCYWLHTGVWLGKSGMYASRLGVTSIFTKQ